MLSQLVWWAKGRTVFGWELGPWDWGWDTEGGKGGLLQILETCIRSSV